METAKISDIKLPGFKALKKTKIELGKAAVLCFVRDNFPISDEVEAVPISYV